MVMAKEAGRGRIRAGLGRGLVETRGWQIDGGKLFDYDTQLNLKVSRCSSNAAMKAVISYEPEPKPEAEAEAEEEAESQPQPESEWKPKPRPALKPMPAAAAVAAGGGAAFAIQSTSLTRKVCFCWQVESALSQRQDELAQELAALGALQCNETFIDC